MASGTWYFVVSTDASISYQLMIELSRAATVTVGKLGRFHFPAGHYVYTGSARRGLEARIRRHLGQWKKCYWHIDYLLARPQARVTGIKRSQVAECAKNRQIRGEILVPGFGATDCTKGCGSHLKYLGPL
jgi:Uri superfamily endonuclease